MAGGVGQLPASAPDVAVFTRLFGLTDPPLFLVHRDEGYGADWCHVSAKHHALKHGGRRVHGWALWQFPDGIMADFHSVWEDTDGTLVDITPPKFGVDEVLFARDRVTDIYKTGDLIVLPTNRRSLPDAPFWWEGVPTSEQVWGLPITNIHLIGYCASLGFTPSDIVTDPTYG